MHKPDLTLIGAGLVGALLATLLAQRGFAVTVFERRPDPRRAGFLGGRSINLALAERGWHGLRVAGLQAAMAPLAVMMRGRMVHALDGSTNLQRYGRDDSEVIWSVNRGALNIALLDAAEAAGARIQFDRRLESVDWDKSTISFINDADGSQEIHPACTLIGSDGAGSALRQAMGHATDLGERFEPLGHGYKELEIPALRSGNAQERFAIEPHALHIWPRGGHMCIALPNAEGSFTVTLFLPNDGEPSFATLTDAESVAAFFRRDFADAVPLMPDHVSDFFHNPTGLLGTLYLDKWQLDARALLLGDAAHAIVPFHGQGMNCGFEDAVELADLLEQDCSDLNVVFNEFTRRRKPNADAIAAMALENYIEMRDRVDDPDYLLMRALERTLAQRNPQHFVPRYAMVTFSRLPYAIARARGASQTQLLRELTRGKQRIEDIDLTAADALVVARLTPVQGDARASTTSTG
ncbi:MAG: NAD(P)/FAD-dependent oxidoreductase [Tahibacter sp.]